MQPNTLVNCACVIQDTQEMVALAAVSVTQHSGQLCVCNAGYSGDGRTCRGKCNATLPSIVSV